MTLLLTWELNIFPPPPPTHSSAISVFFLRSECEELDNISIKKMYCLFEIKIESVLWLVTLLTLINFDLIINLYLTFTQWMVVKIYISLYDLSISNMRMKIIKYKYLGHPPSLQFSIWRWYDPLSEDTTSPSHNANTTSHS